MPRKARPHPSTLVAEWPQEASRDPAVEVARKLAQRLRSAMDGRSAREVGSLSGVDYTTVNAVLNGTTWPDLRTIALLEAALNADLWPVGVARATGDPE